MNDPFAAVAVLGAGTMGHALALVHALGGARVRLYDNDPQALARADGLIASALDTLAEADEISPADGAAAAARISPAATLGEALTAADLVVEAVVEDREVKRALFAEIDTAAPAGAVIASNTSYLDVFPLVPPARQAQTLIAHWYTPPYVIDLVDIAAGPQTRSTVLRRVAAYYRQLGKRPVLFERLIPGYIANRLQAAISLEVFRMLDEGWVSAEMVDDSIRYGLAQRMALLGHLRKADFTGLDMVRRALANGSYAPPAPRTESATLQRLLAAGRGGVHDGAGFFDYHGRPADELLRERDRKLLRLKHALAAIDPAADGSFPTDTEETT